MEIPFGRGENDLLSLHFRHQRTSLPSRRQLSLPNIIIALRTVKNRDLLYYGGCMWINNARTNDT